MDILLCNFMLQVMFCLTILERLHKHILCYLDLSPLKKNTFVFFWTTRSNGLVRHMTLCKFGGLSGTERLDDWLLRKGSIVTPEVRFHWCISSLAPPPPGYVDSFWLMDFPPFRTPETLLLFVGVPLPDRENSVRSWREGSLYMATAERHKSERGSG